MSGLIAIGSTMAGFIVGLILGFILGLIGGRNS